ncbi:hypothetical protein H5410_057127 [Solanum commersonii]|uniref:Uncharacterized protein n=1 Tax=Solanum commersonii TaxID=4109 RepID=A0A9J5WM54_SOLCO|nr:hypothetical protein H5410_057127 [Solanum commersonii]
MLKEASTSQESSKVLTHVKQPPEIQDFVFKALFDLEELLNKKNSEFGAKPIGLYETYADELEQAFDYKEQVSLEVNILRGFPKKNSGDPKFTYSPRCINRKRNWNQTNTSYSGSEIYEWNMDGLTDR